VISIPECCAGGEHTARLPRANPPPLSGPSYPLPTPATSRSTQALASTSDSAPPKPAPLPPDLQAQGVRKHLPACLSTKTAPPA